MLATLHSKGSLKDIRYMFLFFLQVDTVDLDDLEEDEEFGIRAVEELMTDFLQLSHGTIRNILPQDSADKPAGEALEAKFHNLHVVVVVVAVAVDAAAAAAAAAAVAVDADAVKDDNDDDADNVAVAVDDDDDDAVVVVVIDLVAVALTLTYLLCVDFTSCPTKKTAGIYAPSFAQIC